MARPLRITIPNMPFHVLDRGNNRQIVFREEEDFVYFLKLLKRYKKELKFKLYHLCLMPNHIHFMMEPTIAGSLPKIMMRLTLAYSSYFNKKCSGNLKGCIVVRLSGKTTSQGLKLSFRKKYEKRENGVNSILFRFITYDSKMFSD